MLLLHVIQLPLQSVTSLTDSSCTFLVCRSNQIIFLFDGLGQLSGAANEPVLHMLRLCSQGPSRLQWPSQSEEQGLLLAAAFLRQRSWSPSAGEEVAESDCGVFEQIRTRGWCRDYQCCLTAAGFWNESSLQSVYSPFSNITQSPAGVLVFLLCMTVRLVQNDKKTEVWRCGYMYFLQYNFRVLED